MCASSSVSLRSRGGIGPCLPQFSHVNRYEDPQNHCVTAKILPGEYYVTMVDEMITTVLGSCISACIYDSQRHYGGMNHFLLPGGGGQDSRFGDDSTRYGIHAMERMINDILKCGASRENLRAKIFGGGNIIDTMTNVGGRNISFVKQYLAMEGIPVEASDVGLSYPRKVNFYPKTGKARVKRLRELRTDTIQRREREYISELAQAEQQTEPVVFF